MGDKIGSDGQPLVNIASCWPKPFRLKALRERAVKNWDNRSRIYWTNMSDLMGPVEPN